MAKKQILTNLEIEKDIVGAFKKPSEGPKPPYGINTVIGIILAIVLWVIALMYTVFIVRFSLILIGLLIVGNIFYSVWFKYRIKNVTADDYDITKETVYSTDEEHYEGKSRYRRRTGGLFRIKEPIDNYIIHFENGKTWRVPKELYIWHEKLCMRNVDIYNSTHRGDTMITVTEKKSGKIVVAYNTEFFEYKS